MSDVARYRKLPTEIEAMRWTGYNYGEVLTWCDDHIQINAEGDARLFVQANMAWLALDWGEWVARDRHGFYPIKDDVFLESYEPVGTSGSDQ